MVSSAAFCPEGRKCFTVGREYLLCSSWVLVFNAGNLVSGVSNNSWELWKKTGQESREWLCVWHELARPDQDLVLMGNWQSLPRLGHIENWQSLQLECEMLTVCTNRSVSGWLTSLNRLATAASSFLMFTTWEGTEHIYSPQTGISWETKSADTNEVQLVEPMGFEILPCWVFFYLFKLIN